MEGGLDELKQRAFHGLRWMERNLAVKELGKREGDDGAKTILLELIEDRRSAVWWRRCLGDPFFQVGFTRRNAWRALLKHRVNLNDLEEILSLGLEDPYYEVRTATWELLSKVLAEETNEPSPDVKEDLKARIIQEENFEILTSAMGTIDRVCEVEFLLEWACRVEGFKNWRVRAAYLEALERCCERGILDQGRVIDVLKGFNLRSEYFRPVFMLKEHGSRLERRLKVEG